MIRQIELTESASQTIEVTEREAEVLLALGKRLAAKREWWRDEEPVERSVISLSREPGGKWRVLVREAVGVIRAGELQIVVYPKIPQNHFVYLAIQSETVPRVEDIEVSLGRSTDLWELLIHWFLLATERLLRGELARGYTELVDELDVVRGRVLPVETALRVYQGCPVAMCEYEEFTEDIPLNRVVKAAAETVASSPVVPFPLRRRAKAILARFGDVGPLQPRDLSTPLDRLTQRYRSSIAFAKQLLGEGGVELSHGETIGWSFLIRTPELMEAGIRGVLRRRFRPKWKVEKRQRKARGSSVTFNPDLVLGADEVIGDVKYKLCTSEWVRGDLYEAVAFANAFHTLAACIIGFQAGLDSTVPTALEVGDVTVRYFGWETGIPPVQAEEGFVQALGSWLGILRSSTRLGA